MAPSKGLIEHMKMSSQTVGFILRNLTRTKKTSYFMDLLGEVQGLQDEYLSEEMEDATSDTQGDVARYDEKQQGIRDVRGPEVEVCGRGHRGEMEEIEQDRKPAIANIALGDLEQYLDSSLVHLEDLIALTPLGPDRVARIALGKQCHDIQNLIIQHYPKYKTKPVIANTPLQDLEEYLHSSLARLKDLTTLTCLGPDRAARNALGRHYHKVQKLMTQYYPKARAKSTIENQQEEGKQTREMLAPLRTIGVWKNAKMKIKRYGMLEEASEMDKGVKVDVSGRDGDKAMETVLGWWFEDPPDTHNRSEGGIATSQHDVAESGVDTHMSSDESDRFYNAAQYPQAEDQHGFPGYETETTFAKATRQEATGPGFQNRVHQEPSNGRNGDGVARVKRERSPSYKPGYAAAGDGGDSRPRGGYQRTEAPPRRIRAKRISKPERRARRMAREEVLKGFALMKQDARRVNMEQHASAEKLTTPVPSNASRADASSLGGMDGRQANEVDYEMVESGILAHLDEQEEVNRRK